MKQLVMATSNIGKLREVRNALQDVASVVGMNEMGFNEDIPETGTTLHENALIKARYLFARVGEACIADDTGLEVDALAGKPGVFSARYAGPENSAQANMSKLLKELEGVTERGAQFRTVIAYVDGSEEVTLEGVARGTILQKMKGGGGFGYDPVFMPVGETRTFAEMSTEEKNLIGHRGKAVAELVDHLTRMKEKD